MNEKDLLNAMNDIDEDLLALDERKPKKLRGSWKVLIAAALIMAFSVTAYAVGNITTSQKTKIYDADDVWRLYYNTEGKDEVEFYEMSVDYKLEPQKVSDEFYADAVYALNYSYDVIRRTYEEGGRENYTLEEGEELWASMEFSYDARDERNSYTVEELEEYIGLDFCLGDELINGINYFTNLRKAGKTSLWPISITVTGKKASEAEGGFVPLCATITFIAGYDNKGNFIQSAVFICLSEEKTTATSVWMSFEKEGKWSEKIMKTDSGKEIYFIHNNPKKGYRSSARACWTEDGIGYEAYTVMALDWEYKHEGVKYLMPFIENIE